MQHGESMKAERFTAEVNPTDFKTIGTFIDGLNTIAEAKSLIRENGRAFLSDEDGNEIEVVDEEFVKIVTGITHALYVSLRKSGHTANANRIIEKITGVEQLPFRPENYPHLPQNVTSSEFAKNI